MLVLDHLAKMPSGLPYPVMAIGVFDGIHLGHQTILGRLVERTREQNGTSIVLTFHPHPQKIISAADAPALLLTPRQKEEILGKLSIDIMVRLPFTRELSLFAPEQFVREILAQHGIREIHVGSNFRFGHQRSGDFRILQTLGQRFGFEVYEIKQVSFRGIPVSSTRIRAFLQRGQVSLVKRWLNRPYQIRGTVVRGTGKGVQLGIPTANLDPENELVPANGVYATCVRVNGMAYPSVTNIGFRPTLHHDFDRPPVLETHLLDFDQNLYGKPLRLDFCLRLRSEKRFENVDALKKQIEKDIRQTRKYLKRGRKYFGHHD